MSLFAPAPPPQTRLGYHRILSPSCGLRVSPLCLGTMNFGDAWTSFMGHCSKDTVFSILDRFTEAGGNFIDTSPNYQGEQAEQWLGEWMKERNIREEIVLATKFTMFYPGAERAQGIRHRSNYQGNHRKNLKHSLETSLKNLQTDFIDLLYLHWWDFSTPIPEIMHSLHALVLSGKVLYLGISDTPAWVVAKANQYARDHALTPFVVYQGKWNAAERDFERDVLLMCEDEGMAIAPWGALGGGMFKSKEAREKMKAGEGRMLGQAQEKEIKISAKLEEIAARKNATMHGVALAYVIHKAPNVYPIIGGRTLAHLEGNIEALSLSLSDDDMREIENSVEFDVGFPMSFLMTMFNPNVKYDYRQTTADMPIVQLGARLQCVEKRRAIGVRDVELAEKDKKEEGTTKA